MKERKIQKDADDKAMPQAERQAEEDIFDDEFVSDEWDSFGEWFDEHLLILIEAMPFVCAALLVLLLLTAGISGRNSKQERGNESYISSSLRQETEAETDEASLQEMTEKQRTDDPQAADISGANDRQDSDASREESLRETAPEKRQSAEIDELRKKLAEEEKQRQALHDMIFCETGQSTSLGYVTAVTGFTDREKREIGFLESDFLKDIGDFLARQQILTKRVIIEDRIANSSEAGIAFQGRLEGNDDYILDVVFYPDLPGEYIFLLRSIKGNERETQAQPETEAASWNTSQSVVQTQNVQNNDPSQEVRQSAVQPQNIQPAAQPQNSYDATNLSVKSIPETLLNYLDNRYEFQYSLYGWLYSHGKREVESASVTDYSIDGDSKTATIELALSDGSSVTAVYDKTANSYSFER